MEEETKQYIDKTIEEKMRSAFRESLVQSDILPKTIKQRHIEGTIIKMGLAADRPSDGGAVGVLCFFSTDSGVLSIWDGSAWLSTTLS